MKSNLTGGKIRDFLKESRKKTKSMKIYLKWDQDEFIIHFFKIRFHL